MTPVYQHSGGGHKFGGKYGWYEGKVVKLGRLIATIRYRMKNGGLAKWTAPTTDVVVLPRAGRLTVD